jgi:uncharacterized protein
MSNVGGTIDRIAATIRPPDWPVMRQRWAKLLFLHWEVDPDVLRPLIPSQLTLDLFDGRAFVGLVPFTMRGIRLPFLPAAWGLSAFHEVNVRTYVHLDGRDPGVWFFSLDAANRIAVRVARRFWRLPYHFARISLRTESSGWLNYHSERLWPDPLPAGCSVRYQPLGSASPASIGGLEHFLVERYILYAQGPSGLLRGRVHHFPYPLQNARIEGLDESLLVAAGIARPQDPPRAHFASEVRVRVYPLRSVSPDIR